MERNFVPISTLDARLIFRLICGTKKFPKGDAHRKSILVHHQVILPVTGGRLNLGPWQQVYYAEFDGRRRKRVIIKVLAE